ncbi:DUF3152 domain-containing protein [Micromonospora sp. WMMD558]|uniref:DUF3152 domain-containing protein n=1 Tax=unclassified Micromonospora TaxID=2617518 RepID=UPI0012B4DE8F|nr:DUF3152 domain-containing protein [Micromonospora sp. WMMC415]QGN46748.1 DUF3152 domain-containing protein [Micromonospora sp. WMMC415]
MTAPSSSGPSARPPRPGRVRMRRRRRRALRLGVVLLLAAAASVALVRAAEPPAGSPPDRTSYGAAAERPQPGGYPRVGAGSFVTATGDTDVRGADGPLRRYRVAVERDIGHDAGTFAATVDEVLGDSRSWIGSSELRVQRVEDADLADFTVYLATPDTSERMCAEGGLSTEGYTSCRLPGQVIINLARWVEGVPDYGAPLAVYRSYVINHEVGHEFGEWHEACPGPGAPAPVMQQQTYGLDGCVANPWPYLDGRRHAGEPVPGT